MTTTPRNTTPVVVRVVGAAAAEVKTVVNTAAVPNKGAKGDKGDVGPIGPASTVAGPRGPAGVPGTSGADHTIKLARVPLSAGRVVRLDGAEYCAPVDAMTRSDACAAIGLTQFAISTPDSDVGITLYGEYENADWNLTPGGALFVSANGFVVQARDPAWVYARVVGFAITPTRAFIDPQLPVFQQR